MDTEIIVKGPATWLLLIITFLILLYIYGTRTFGYFRQLGIPGPEPWPFIGNAWGTWNQDMQKTDLALVRKYGEIFGYFTGPTPTLFTTNPELIRSIFVKNFECFADKRPEIAGLKSRYFRRFIGFILGGPMWKDVRSSISLAFTSSKICEMSGTFVMSANRLVERLGKEAASTGRIDKPKMVFGSFMKDAVCNCVIGTRDMKSDEYTEKAFAVTNIPLLHSPLLAINFMFPGLRDWLPAKMREGRIVNHNLFIFLNVMKEQIRKRWESDLVYGDFIDTATKSLLSAKKDNGKAEFKPMWTKEDAEEILVAQGGGFVVAGFETAYSILFACIYHLAKNQEIQQKLYLQLKEELKIQGNFSMALVQQISYADCIIKEALRMHPPVKRITRQCTRDISIGNIHFKKGMIVSCPLYALHRLEKNFKEPNRFIPDRWLSDNAGDIKPYTYLPFGAGPRLCIGQRFAMHEIRIALCASILNFNFFYLPETPDDLLFDTSANPIGSPLDIPLGIKRRSTAMLYSEDGDYRRV